MFNKEKSQTDGIDDLLIERKAMKTRTLVNAIQVLMVIGAMAVAPAQMARYGFDGGPAKSTEGGNSIWKTGASLGAQIFYIPEMQRWFQIGGRLAYTHWNLNKEDVLKDITTPIAEPKSAGEMWNLEIMPAARFQSHVITSIFNAFGQVGIGWNMRKSNASVSGVLADGAQYIRSVRSETQASLAATIGGGLAIGYPDYLTLDIFPQYHLVFQNKTIPQYFTVNFGIMVGL
jgi:hypothetical protein